jgi:hypothetical protein
MLGSMLRIRETLVSGNAALAVVGDSQQHLGNNWASGDPWGHGSGGTCPRVRVPTNTFRNQ